MQFIAKFLGIEGATINLINIESINFNINLRLLKNSEGYDSDNNDNDDYDYWFGLWFDCYMNQLEAIKKDHLYKKQLRQQGRFDELYLRTPSKQ